MTIRIFAVSLIALPIASIIGSAVVMGNASLATRAVAGAGNAQTAGAARPGAAADTARAAARGSGGNAVAVRALTRRPVSTVGRLVPLAQPEDLRGLR